MRTKIVGVTHPNSDGTSRRKILKRMRREECEYEAVYLEPEPDNPYDKNAVKVLNIMGEQIGYLSSDLAEDIVKRISKGEEFSAVITSFTGDEDGKPTVGCNIQITSRSKGNAEREIPSKDRIFDAKFFAVVITIICIIVLCVTDVKKKEAGRGVNKPYTHSYLLMSSDTKPSGHFNSDDKVKPLQDKKELDKQAEQRKKSEAYELNELRKKMTSNVDKVTGIKWIYEKTTKKAIDRQSSKKNLFFVYLGQDTELKMIWPRLRMEFIRDGWIFFTKVIINIDGKVKSLSFNSFEVKRDVLGGHAIDEYIDLPADKYEELIKSMSKGKKVLVRFEGDQYYHDFTMTQEQKAALSNIWRLYELMR